MFCVYGKYIQELQDNPGEGGGGVGVIMQSHMQKSVENCMETRIMYGCNTCIPLDTFEALSLLARNGEFGSGCVHNPLDSPFVHPPPPSIKHQKL